MIRFSFDPQAMRYGILIVLLSAAATAQTAPPPSAETTPLSSKGTLSDAPGYIDGSFGFSLIYPQGSIFEREKHFITPAELEIVRFVNLPYTWSLAVHLVTEERPVNPADLLQKTAAQLSLELADFASVRSDVATIGSREGARFACTFKADNQQWFRQQAFLRKSPTEYYTFIFLAPQADQELAVTSFDLIVNSFKILRSELEQQRIEAALKRGADFKLLVAKNRDRLNALGKQDTFLRYLENGKEIGFRRTLQTPRERDGRSGVFIHEWSWMFRYDKSITQIQQVMFISHDLSYAEWDNRTRVFIPTDQGKPVSMFGIEMGLLKDDMLLMDYTPTFNASELKEKAIAVEPSFGPPAWFAILPQILDLKKPELYAFSAYDSDRRGLILRTYELVGPTRIIIDNKQLPAIRIRDSEGLQPPFNEIDVDPTGKLLRAHAGPVELLATTQSYVEKNIQNPRRRGPQNLRQVPRHSPFAPQT